METNFFVAFKGKPGARDDAFAHLRKLSLPSYAYAEDILERLDNGGISRQELNLAASNERESETHGILLRELTANGLLELKSSPGRSAVTLVPVSDSFKIQMDIDLSSTYWLLSKFAYVHRLNGDIVIANSNALCRLRVESEEVLKLVFLLNKPVSLNDMKKAASLNGQFLTVVALLVHAEVALPCDGDGNTLEDRDPRLRQWEFHELLFHSLSRLGRTDRPIGGTFRFMGILPPQPAVKENPWREKAVPLPKADIDRLMAEDLSLTTAIEKRASYRDHSMAVITKQELGEFLYRTARIMDQYPVEWGEVTSRPYPSGGANYEDELYLTINRCADIERGFYYYDAKDHTLCLVQKPCPEMESLLLEAAASAVTPATPQVLITIASRFLRFNWKYCSMGYAAQLKNVGVIYQTMYLVATAMNLGGCALGLGNTDRFCRLARLDYLEEGSVGEFILGRVPTTLLNLSHAT